MVHERIWVRSFRNVEECREVLLRIDSNPLERRVSRLSKESCVLMPIDYSMPGWTSNLIDEAGMCFTYKQYTGCIVSLALGMEHGLRKLCDRKVSDDLQPLIQSAVDSGFVEAQEEEEMLTNLRKYRNYKAHAQIDKLAEGIPSDLRTIELTGIESTEDLLTKRTKHGIPLEEEARAHLSAESSVEEIFLEVSEAMFDIFDRANWEPKDPDAQS